MREFGDRYEKHLDQNNFDQDVSFYFFKVSFTTHSTCAECRTLKSNEK